MCLCAYHQAEWRPSQLIFSMPRLSPLSSVCCSGPCDGIVATKKGSALWHCSQPVSHKYCSPQCAPHTCHMTPAAMVCWYFGWAASHLCSCACTALTHISSDCSLCDLCLDINRVEWGFFFLLLSRRNLPSCAVSFPLLVCLCDLYQHLTYRLWI